MLSKNRRQGAKARKLKILHPRINKQIYDLNMLKVSVARIINADYLIPLFYQPAQLEALKEVI